MRKLYNPSTTTCATGVDQLWMEKANNDGSVPAMTSQIAHRSLLVRSFRLHVCQLWNWSERSKLANYFPFHLAVRQFVCSTVNLIVCQFSRYSLFHSFFFRNFVNLILSISQFDGPSVSTSICRPTVYFSSFDHPIDCTLPLNLLRVTLNSWTTVKASLDSFENS